MYLTLLATDCYGTLRIDWQGADLQTLDMTFNPEAFKAITAFAQDPAGWVQMYRRPNPESTAGAYFTVLTGGFQGAIWPYIPTIKMSILLPTDSTQASAYIRAESGVIAITNEKAFIHSLRRVLDAKASLKVDDALLAIGPAEFKEAKP